MKNFARTSAILACAALLTSAAPAHAAQGDMVRLSQHRLADLGYYSGNYDGVIGPVTASALSDFQASNRLPVSGHLDAVTYNLLLSMDYRLSNGTAAHLVYTDNWNAQQPVVIHYGDGSTAMATRYVTPTAMPVAYYNYDANGRYLGPDTMPVAYYGYDGYDARYVQPVAYYGDATSVTYESGCYGVSNEGTWHAGNCR